MRRIDITIDGLKRKKPIVEEPEEQDVVWPTLLEDDQPVLCTVEMEFFNLASQKSGEEYVAQSFIEDVEPIEAQSGPTDLDPIGDFRFSPHAIKTTVQVGPSKFGEETLGAKIEELGADFWDKMPLPSVIIDSEDGPDRDDDGRWTFRDGRVNLRVQFLKANGGDARKDLSPDLVLDEETSSGSRIVEVTPSKYRFQRVMPGSYGLKVDEIGTKAMLHEISAHDGHAGYTYSWLDPEGILLSPFDTTDTDNIKVTVEPSFDADAVSGNILSVTPGKTRVKVFMMPRLWACYARSTTVTGEDDYEAVSQEFLANDCRDELNQFPAYDDSCWIPGWTFDKGSIHYPVVETPWQCDPRTYSFKSIDWMDRGHYAECVDCSGTITINRCDGDLIIGPPCTFVIEHGLHPYYGNTRCVTRLVDPPSGGCGHLLYSNQASWSVQFVLRRQKWTIISAVSIQYRYPPLGFTLNGPRGYSKNILHGSFYRAVSLKEWTSPEHPPAPPSEYQALGSLTMIGDESRDDAIESLVRAGLSQDEAEKRVISGYKSIHLYAGSPDLFYVTGCLGYGNPHFKTQLNLGSKADFGPLTSSFSDVKTNLFNQLWPAVEGVPGGSDNVTIDDRPVGVGLCPNLSGTLIAVVHVRNKIYYVWRKTDEAFTVRSATIEDQAGASAGVAGGPVVSFESGAAKSLVEVDRELASLMAGEPIGYENQWCRAPHTIYGLWIDHSDNRFVERVGFTFEVNCKKKWPKLDADRVWIERSEDALVNLETPFWIVMSREHAWYTAANTNRLCRYTEELSGSEFPYSVRSLR